MSTLAELFPMIIVTIIVVSAYVKNIKVFSVFIEGAKKGIQTSISILPTLIGLITAISMLSASGLLDFTSELLSPVCNVLNIPSQIIPLAILKPISGSGSTSAMINIFENYGADSKIGKMASVLMSSTETTFYAVAVYFSIANFKKSLYTVPVALAGDMLTVILTIIIVNATY
ncbi:MAG: nucleoside recognition domain-containing protein [Clostridia bacterium]